MDLTRIRRVIISAAVSDDLLFETLVLKGGNALNLVHGIGARASLDVDFSMAGDFADLDAARARLFRALRDRFDSLGYHVFDEKLTPQPPRPPSEDPTWGGYRVEFKLIHKSDRDRLGGNLSKMRSQAVMIGERSQRRTFKVEISKHEYCAGKVEAEVDGVPCYVYTLPMIAVEKLRAICQQMEGYPLVRNKTARARDFYDIWTILQTGLVELAAQQELVREMFGAKDVPLGLLGRIRETRAFHAPDWPAVADVIGVESQGFDYYFDGIAAAVERDLKPLWVE